MRKELQYSANKDHVTRRRLDHVGQCYRHKAPLRKTGISLTRYPNIKYYKRDFNPHPSLSKSDEINSTICFGFFICMSTLNYYYTTVPVAIQVFRLSLILTFYVCRIL